MLKSLNASLRSPEISPTTHATDPTVLHKCLVRAMRTLSVSSKAATANRIAFQALLQALNSSPTTFAKIPLMSTHAIETSHAAPPVGPYPHARRVGDWLLLSGVGPRRPGTAPGESDIPGVTLSPDGSIASHDITAQTHAVMANVKAILAASGASWNDLVDVTVYLTDMKNDFKSVNALWLEYFPEPAYRPCRTTVEINALPTPIAIELKCMAYLGPAASAKGENA